MKPFFNRIIIIFSLFLCFCMLLSFSHNKFNENSPLKLNESNFISQNSFSTNCLKINEVASNFQPQQLTEKRKNSSTSEKENKNFIMLSLDFSSNGQIVQSINFGVDNDFFNQYSKSVKESLDFRKNLIKNIETLRNEFFFSFALTYMKNPVEEYKINKGAVLTAVAYNEENHTVGFKIAFPNINAWNYYHNEKLQEDSNSEEKGEEKEGEKKQENDLQQKVEKFFCLASCESKNKTLQNDDERILILTKNNENIKKLNKNNEKNINLQNFNESCEISRKIYENNLKLQKSAEKGNIFIKKVKSEGVFPFSTTISINEKETITVGERYKRLFLQSADGLSFYQKLKETYQPIFVYDYSSYNQKLRSNSILTFLDNQGHKHHLWLKVEKQVDVINVIQTKLQENKQNFKSIYNSSDFSSAVIDNINLSTHKLINSTQILNNNDNSIIIYYYYINKGVWLLFTLGVCLGGMLIAIGFVKYKKSKQIKSLNQI